MMCLFLQYHDKLKCINHGRKVAKLSQTDKLWFQDVLQLSRQKDLCMYGYDFINHGLLFVYVKQ